MTTTVTALGKATVFTVGTVDLANQLQSITMTKTVDALESTSLVDASRRFVAGLESSETTFTVLGSFATTEAIQTIFGDVGIESTIVFEPLASAPGTSSPRYTHSNAFLASAPIVVEVGSLLAVTATYTGGAIVQALTT
jgi:hypothetical protein